MAKQSLIEKKVAEIFALSRKAQLTSGRAIWFELFGHVNGIRVKIAKSSDMYQDVIFEDSTYTDNTDGEAHKKLNAMIAALKKVIK